jgi:hypothetical protein
MTGGNEVQQNNSTLHLPTIQLLESFLSAPLYYTFYMTDVIPGINREREGREGVCRTHSMASTEAAWPLCSMGV